MLMLVGEIIVICPWIIWGFLFMLLTTIKFTKKKAVFFASDITTIFLLFSIQRLVYQLFNMDLGVLVLIGAVVLAIIMVIYEWKTNSDLELGKVLKKIWRTLFVLLTCLYIIVLLMFCVLWFIQLVK